MKQIDLAPDGDTVEMAVMRAHGRGTRGTVLVQVVRAPSGVGWLVTTNTCGS